MVVTVQSIPLHLNEKSHVLIQVFFFLWIDIYYYIMASMYIVYCLSFVLVYASTFVLYAYIAYIGCKQMRCLFLVCVSACHCIIYYSRGADLSPHHI